MTRRGVSPKGGRPPNIKNQGMGMTKREGQQETLEPLLNLLPPNGTAVGNAALLERWTEAATAAGTFIARYIQAIVLSIHQLALADQDWIEQAKAAIRELQPPATLKFDR